MSTVLQNVKTYGSLIKFSHTIFALPFALTSVVFASYEIPFSFILKEKLIWIIIAMAGARSAAMGFNRVVDRDYDSKNPRTKNREIPAGKISIQSAWFFIVISSVALVYASYMLNELCFYLSPVALVTVFFYSLTKRFTWLAHIFLGIATGLAPVGAWIAVTGEFSLVSILLGFTVLVWMAGFDIIYACQDIEFDESIHLKSIPVRFGVDRSLQISKLFHSTMIILLCLVWLTTTSGYILAAGILVIGALLIYEHSLVNPTDFSKLNIAFFNMNGIISTVLFLFVIADRFF